MCGEGSPPPEDRQRPHHAEAVHSGGAEERMVTKKSPQFKAARKSDAGDSFGSYG